MSEQCIRCKNITDNLINIRDDIELEPLIYQEFPDALNIDENLVRIFF